MKIEVNDLGPAPTYPEWERYLAYDADTYDGAPDSSIRNQYGRGKTPEEAVVDLKERLEVDI